MNYLVVGLLVHFGLGHELTWWMWLILFSMQLLQARNKQAQYDEVLAAIRGART